MTIPALLFGLILALLAGALYHAVRGGDGLRLLVNSCLSILGFAIGQWGSMAFGWTLFPFGALDIGFGLIGSILLLLLGDWLSRMEPRKKKGV